MSATTPLRTIPAGNLTFDYETVLTLARHLTPSEQEQLILTLLRERGGAADAETLRARFAAWEAESAADPPTAEDEAAYHDLLARLNRDAA